MRNLLHVSVLLAAIALTAASALAQTEDVRAATGLPIPIGAPVIFGQVNIHGMAPGEKRPNIFVSLIVGGVLVERTQTNDRGYYYFLRLPADGMGLVFEVSNTEVGRTVLSAGTGSSTRRDVDLDWKSISAGTNAPPGVISLRSLYKRDEAGSQRFERAAEASKAKDSVNAIRLFKEVVAADPLDFVAWTELGTVYFIAGDKASAASSYSKAVELKPDFTPALINLGKLYFSDKRYELAIASLLKAAASDQTSAETFHLLGESYLQIKQGSKAVLALNEAIRLSPIEMAELHLRLAALYNAAGMKAKAADEYKALLKKVPNHADKEQYEKYIRENGQ